ncbi:unnamed protein product [Cylindrotheca closterium]|uniref:Feruloyl esterase n=1 Tax=Cylindrotheca closterium TaxID=2856 RepID=A0AAD2CDI5_9STRA|nr:unnamed protein product [Cylindrotheca closterium]
MLEDWKNLLLGSQQQDGRRQILSLREMCGNMVYERFEIPNCTSTNDAEYSRNYEGTDDYCTREYDMYIPTAACDRKKYGPTNVLPLVFAVHCYGCDAGVMDYMADYAETYSFVLAIPHGIANSFNAQQCCGTALEQNVDDVGFFQAIIEDISSRWMGHSHIVSPNVVYGFGWSNGGYMVVNAAHLFRAIAPVSGYQVYDDPAIGLSSLVEKISHRPIGLFLHHSQDDQNVAITGCCTDPTMPECCCGLSNYADQCQSATSFVDTFGQTVNHCQGEPTQLLEKLYREQRADVTCYQAGSNCWANTTYCIHNHRGHFNRPSLEAAFPMSDEVSDFFARDACENVGGGSWSSEERYCTCDNIVVGDSSYCLNLAWTERYQEPDWANYSIADGGTTSSLGAIALSFVIIVAFLGIFVMAREERKYRHFKAVSTFELSDFSVDPKLDDEDDIFRPRLPIVTRPTLSKHI